MSPRQMALVQPEVLRWARESAAYDIETAAKRLQVKPERLAEWESGTQRPTVKQLHKVATVYRRPFAALFRSKPPPFAAPIPDFRLGWEGDDKKLSPALVREIRRARFRQRVAIDLAEESEDATTPTFDLALTSDQSPEVAAQVLRSFVGVDLQKQKMWTAGRETFNNWRDSFEQASVLIFQSADVETTEMRGFSLASKMLPAIVVNRKDAHAGKVFTLFHELTHLAKGHAGVCDLGDDDGKEETYCNAVAAEVLVPSYDFRYDPPQAHDGAVAIKAREYGVSEEVIWRRLLDLGSITRGQYRAKRQMLAERFDSAVEEERQRRRLKGGGGPPPSREAVSLGGRYYTGLVMSALSNGNITSADAAEYIGVRAKHFDQVLREVGPRA